jgi:hypothetical protein
VQATSREFPQECDPECPLAGCPRDCWRKSTPEARLPGSAADRTVYNIVHLIYRAGGMMGHGTRNAELLEIVALYVNRILRSAKINEFPVQFRTKFRFISQDRKSDGPVDFRRFRIARQ